MYTVCMLHVDAYKLSETMLGVHCLSETMLGVSV